MNCDLEELPNTTLQNVLKEYEGSTVKILDDWIVEAYVISTDEAGNFFNTLHVQDSPSDPTCGIQIEVELRDSHLFFEPGDKILIHVKGLYLGKSKGILRLGSAYSSFGTLQPGRIPKHAVFKHIVKSCTASFPLIPKHILISELDIQPANTLIRLDQLEFAEEELDSSFARARESTLRRLVNCEDREVILMNSGYSDFFKESLPAGMGDITAIYYPEGGDAKLIIRSPADLDFTEERCQEWITEFTSEKLIISELADPDNNNAARFVELYYAGDENLPLKGWRLDRYTNDNLEKSSSVLLSDFTIGPGQFLIIAANALVFQETYGFPPDLEAGVNSPADSNGDDNIVLVDPFDKIIDIFGRIGEDGSGTDHEFEDGRAIRKNAVILANSVFTPAEWVIYNDTGASGTINQPQIAPGDFTPGFGD